MRTRLDFLKSFDGIIRYSTNAGQSIASGPTLICEDIDICEVPGYDPSTGCFTAPWECEVDYYGQCQAAVALTSVQNITLNAQICTVVKTYGGSPGDCSNPFSATSGSCKLKKGDTFRFIISSSVVGNLVAADYENFICLNVRRLA